MTEALVFALVLGGLMAWRGYRRGALVSLLGWLPHVAGTVVLAAALRIATDAPEHLALLGSTGLLGGLGTYAFLRAVTRPRRLDLWSRRTGSASRSSWQALLDRLAGAVLGLVHSSVLCLAGALLASAVIFVAASGDETPPPDAAPAQASPLLEWMRRSTERLAEVAARTTLEHLPRVDLYCAEVKALITLLNAPPEDQRRLSRALDLERLAGLPAVTQAVADKEYCALVGRVSKGHVTAIYAIAGHARTQRLMECPEIRALAKRLRPTELVKVVTAR